MYDMGLCVDGWKLCGGLAKDCVPAGYGGRVENVCREEEEGVRLACGDDAGPARWACGCAEVEGLVLAWWEGFLSWG